MSWPAQILAAPANHIVISEVQTGSATDASWEFVELYNPTSAVIVLDDWTLEYASSAATTWTKKATIMGSIPAFGYYLISTAGYALGNGTMSAGLASTGGHVRIKNANSTVIDLVGWGTASRAEVAPAAAAPAGGSIERAPGRLSSLAGNGEDSDNNLNDFVVRDMAEPQRISSEVENPSLVPVEVPEPELIDDTPVISPIYLPIYITEAFPDPASPLTDAKDEFIELYNPNDIPVNLKGYSIRIGANFRSYYTIGDVTISPGAYTSFYPVSTKLGLTNSGGAVQLVDPLGNVLDVTDSYTAAKTGQAWADINGLWMWTMEPTPGAMNVLLEPAPKLAVTTATSTAPKSTTKKTAAKKTPKTKAAVKKITKAAVKKSKSKVPKTSIAATTSTITEPSPLARWLLIASGCFTIMYAIYGFRHDLYNYYIKTRRNITTWIQDRPTMPWRRDH